MQGTCTSVEPLRDDWRSFTGYRVKDLKHRPGQGGGNASFDWDGLDEALNKRGANVESPPTTVRLTYRTLSAEEREALGRYAHRHWVAVREQQRAAGQSVADEELRPWDELPDAEKELFRRGGESMAAPEEAMWAAIGKHCELMGEKAFRRKMFELSVSVAVEKLNPDWSDAERYRATDLILKLSEMLDVPPSPEVRSGRGMP